MGLLLDELRPHARFIEPIAQGLAPDSANVLDAVAQFVTGWMLL